MGILPSSDITMYCKLWAGVFGLKVRADFNVKDRSLIEERLELLSAKSLTTAHKRSGFAMVAREKSR